jgi:alpha,alpha-trehalase
MTNYRTYLGPHLLENIEEYVMGHWEETVRVRPNDDGTLIGLPYPYTVPSRKDAFHEMYYWDTYFTCAGLLRAGRGELAISNTRNLLYLAEKYGYVPNGNRTFYLTRSQPPYLAAIVDMVADRLGKPELRQEALPGLRKEYEFWTTQRITATGLSRNGHNATRAELIAFHEEIAARVALPQDPTEALPRLAQTMAECEGGADFTSRYEDRCMDFCPVDLNCLLYQYECFFARHGREDERVEWSGKAEKRLELIHRYFWDEGRGGFFDYDMANERRSPFVIGWMQPMWAGIATKAQAGAIVERILPRIEFPFGIAGCPPQASGRVRQWDYPNSWPCLQYLAWTGLQRYGYAAEALRIAQKYLATVARSFEETGDLWEKYNVEDGSTRTVAETGYGLGTFRDSVTGKLVGRAGDDAPSMMGWSAGVYLEALALHRECKE